MAYQFKIISNTDLDIVIPLVYKLNEGKVAKAVLKERFTEMKQQSYKCAGVFYNDILIGVCGLWFCTRHYTGKSVELDHVYIEENYRSKGIGKQFMQWINDYVTNEGCKAIELNTYVQNYPSHKFYNNEGFEAWGYHFFKHL